MPKISIVIPAYNAAEFVHIALNSLIEQSVEDYEVIVINDGSTDNTAEVVQSYIKQHPNRCIRLISQQNQGVSRTRNNGINAAAGDYVCFLDADDEYCERSLERRIQCLEKWNLDFAIGHSLKVLTKNQPVKELTSIATIYPEIIAETSGNYHLCDAKQIRLQIAERGFPVHPNAITFRRSVLESIGGFDVDLKVNEDLEMIYRTFFKLDRIGYVDEYLSVYNYYMQYVNTNGHIRTNIKTYYINERQFFMKLIKLLYAEGFDKQVIRKTKRRICARKYKYLGLVAYRENKNLKAIKYLLKARRIDGNDKEIKRLIAKALVPNVFRTVGMKILNRAA